MIVRKNFWNAENDPQLNRQPVISGSRNFLLVDVGIAFTRLSHSVENDLIAMNKS